MVAWACPQAWSQLRYRDVFQKAFLICEAGKSLPEVLGNVYVCGLLSVLVSGFCIFSQTLRGCLIFSPMHTRSTWVVSGQPALMHLAEHCTKFLGQLVFKSAR